jgi:RES domain-containing protein
MASSADRVLWRLTRPEYAPGMDGIGARRAGGRWNSPGTAIVYTAGSLALAVLEVFVHLPPQMRRPGALPALMAVRLVLPGSVSLRELSPADLPDTPAPADFRAIGDAWAASGETAVLAVPSRVVPQERNFLVNPAHPQAARIVVAAVTPFTLDPRLAG